MGRCAQRNVGRPAYRAVMDSVPVVNIDVLWPELAEQRRAFEVVVTMPRQDGGEPLVPRAASRGTRLLVSRSGGGLS